MKPGGGALKGGEYERVICRKLTEWITGKEKPEIFWRSASSGAKATQDYKRGHKSKMGGDIVAIDERGQWFTDEFSIECKDRGDYGNLDLLLWGKGDFLKWWTQCVDDAKKSKKQPLMIFKRLWKPNMVAHWLHPHIYEASRHIVFTPGGPMPDIIICEFGDWMDENDWTRMKSGLVQRPVRAEGVMGRDSQGRLRRM